jgi:serine/threonine-protein kinase
MGTLYLARDPVLDRNIALKLLLGDIDLPGVRERFVREARAAAALSNPNIVTIYDYGDYESQPYIVMEYIHGETLAELIRRRPELPVSVRLRWMEELCSAVGYAHARGIIHRDIKPPNLMIDAYGRLKVLDFGIARMQGALVTNSTALIGTPGYTAPEQIRGGQIDHRSDLFSIGVVCYELLAYTMAFSGDTVHVVTNKILNEDPPPLSRVCSVDSELEALIMKALQKAADARFASTDALRQALADVRLRLEADSDVTTMRYVSPVGAISPRRASSPATPSLRPTTDRGARSVAASSTPLPDSGRTDRENAARLRVAQVQAHLRESVVAGNWASLSNQHRAAITGAATVIVVATVIGTGLYLGTPPTSSLVVLDATPWATITQIQNGDGEPQPLPEMPSTPLAVQLAPGAYTVSFEGPPPQSEKRTIEIRVESGAAHTAPVQRFAAPSVDEYFRPYLTAPAPVSEPGAPLEEGLQ